MSGSAGLEIEAIEVWGCGGSAEALEAAASAQANARDDKARLIERARQVDKAQFANNEFDRDNLLGKTFGGGTKAMNR